MDKEAIKNELIKKVEANTGNGKDPKMYEVCMKIIKEKSDGYIENKIEEKIEEKKKS